GLAASQGREDPRQRVDQLVLRQLAAAAHPADDLEAGVLQATQVGRLPAVDVGHGDEDAVGHRDGAVIAFPPPARQGWGRDRGAACYHHAPCEPWWSAWGPPAPSPDRSSRWRPAGSGSWWTAGCSRG